MPSIIPFLKGKLPPTPKHRRSPELRPSLLNQWRVLLMVGLGECIEVRAFEGMGCPPPEIDCPCWHSPSIFFASRWGDTLDITWISLHQSVSSPALVTSLVKSKQVALEQRMGLKDTRVVHRLLRVAILSGDLEATTTRCWGSAS